MILYRPVGLQELELIYDSGMKAFPARLPKQPIFYPVLDLEYARQTAAGWNAKSGASAGYVTQFKVDDSYIGQFEEHTVGKSQHQELWVPTEELEKFNLHIVGHIKVVEAHFGKAFQGFIPDAFALKGKDAVEQFTLLANTYLYKRMDFYLEIKRNHKAVFLNYPFWQAHVFKNPRLKEKIVKAIKEAWLTSFPQIPLPLPPPVPEETPPVKQINSAARPMANPVQEATAPRKQTETRLSTPPRHNNPTPARQTNPRPPAPPARVPPAQKAITPTKPTDHPAPEQQLVNSVDEEAAPVKQTDARSSLKPFDEEPQTLKSRDSQSFVDSPDEEFTLEEETDSLSLDDFSDEDEETRKPRSSQSFVDSLEEDFTLEEDIDSTSEEDDIDEIDEDSEPVMPGGSRPWVRPVHEDLTLEEETDLADSEDSDEDDSRAVKAADSQSWTGSFREPITTVKKTDSHFSQGIALGLGGKYREAIAELFKAIQEDPDHAVAHTSLGVAFHRLGEEDRALSCYESALRIDPKYAEAHYFQANLLYQRGNVREAMAAYTLAIGLEPDLISAHQQAIPKDRLTDYSPSPAELHRISRSALRILDLNKSLETYPQQADLFKARAAEYSRLWNHEQAIADYSSSLAIQPDDAEAHYLRGLAYEQIGGSDRAVEDYRRANAINPQLAEMYIHRGVDFGKAGNFRQSIASLTEGLRLAPQNADAYFNRGMSYLQLGDLESAIQDFSDVIRLAPEDEAAYYWRGISYEEAGQRREAIPDYRQFLGLSQDKKARAEIEQRLSQWSEVKQDVISEERQQRKQPPSRRPDRTPDVYDLIATFEKRALRSIWFGSGVECKGETAEELYTLTAQQRPIPGEDFLRIAAGIHETIKGDFQAFDPDERSPWIFIRAWDGNGFYIETEDPQVEKDLKKHFPALEEVEGAEPPYVSLFLPL